MLSTCNTVQNYSIVWKDTSNTIRIIFDISCYDSAMGDKHNKELLITNEIFLSYWTNVSLLGKSDKSRNCAI